MRLLVLGGTLFLSRELAGQAVAAGHEVTCACRGSSGSVPEGAEHVVLDRAADVDPDGPVWRGLADEHWDAVVDVTSTPSWATTAVRALAPRTSRWVYVSSISAYADLSRPGGTPQDTPLLPPADGDLAPPGDPEAYGRSKVACEQTVQQALGERALIARPGLIVGPGDPTGRFTYWPVRLARGGRAVAPAPATAAVQVVDVRDLAAWLLAASVAGLSGTVDAVGPQQSRQELLREVARGVGTEVEPVWVEEETLTELDVRPWSGPRSLPLWVPGEMAGMLARDVTATVAAGLRCRPLAQTAADTLAWVRDTPDVEVTGLTRAEEADALAALELRPRSRTVHAALVAAGVPGRIVTLPDAATTAPLAAAALGCEVGAIANSLVFLADDRPLLVMASGEHRVDTTALAARLGRDRIERASPEQVRRATGQAIGGVAPVGHPEPVETVVDESLQRFDRVWAAGGTPHTVFPMTYAELLALTGGREVRVSAG